MFMTYFAAVGVFFVTPSVSCLVVVGAVGNRGIPGVVGRRRTRKVNVCVSSKLICVKSMLFQSCIGVDVGGRWCALDTEVGVVKIRIRDVVFGSWQDISSLLLVYRSVDPPRDYCGNCYGSCL